MLTIPEKPVIVKNKDFQTIIVRVNVSLSGER